jgi:hypothetical protein
VVTTIIYLEHADTGEAVPDHLLASLSPLCWEHINLTGDLSVGGNALARCRRVPPHLVLPQTLILYIRAP